MTTFLMPSVREYRVVELMPGDVCIGLAGDQFKTLLGSCVAVILTDPNRTVGAMCHIVHVRTPPPAEAQNNAFGIFAMATMFELLRRVGVVPQMCHAYVYGGGNMFPDLIRGETVGERNVEWVMAYLEAQRVVVVEHSLLGAGHRTVSWAVGLTPPKVSQVPVESV
jgi:chemotaxis protein CheD